MKADKSNFYGYNKRLQPFANKLRKDMTKAEACLWKYALRARKMKGCQFRRQRPVLNYIADFMCKELKLVIEVDGITHHFEETIKKDKKKTRDLEQAGFKVIRFSDDEVLNNMDGVIRQIEDGIDGLKGHPFDPRSAGGQATPGSWGDTPASGGQNRKAMKQIDKLIISSPTKNRLSIGPTTGKPVSLSARRAAGEGVPRWQGCPEGTYPTNT